MTNEKIINNFINGAKNGHTPYRYIGNDVFSNRGCTLRIEDDNLINYNTIIAMRTSGGIWLNEKKYSRTTSKIQSMIRRLI